MSEDTYKLILKVLEEHDGCCMDNWEERERVARAVAEVVGEYEDYVKKHLDEATANMVEAAEVRAKAAEDREMKALERVVYYEGDEPGTPGGAVAGLFQYAEERCGRSPVVSHPPLQDIENFIQKLEVRCEELRKLADRSAAESGLYAKRMGEAQQERSRAHELLESCRAQLKRTQDDRDTAMERAVKAEKTVGRLQEWAQDIVDEHKRTRQHTKEYLCACSVTGIIKTGKP